MNKFFLAIFIDLENVAGIEFDLDNLIKALMLEDEHRQQGNGSDNSYVFAIKEAYGAMHTIPRGLKTQLTEHNFSLQDTPHIAKKKNRSDLYISINHNTIILLFIIFLEFWFKEFFLRFIIVNYF